MFFLVVFWMIVAIVFQHTVVHRKAKMPEDLAQMELMDVAPSSTVPALDAPAPGKVGAVPLDSLDELKDNLKVFTDSVHQKASQVISWMQAVEPHQTDSSKKCLVLKNWLQQGLAFNCFFQIKIIILYNISWFPHAQVRQWDAAVAWNGGILLPEAGRMLAQHGDRQADPTRSGTASWFAFFFLQFFSHRWTADKLQVTAGDCCGQGICPRSAPRLWISNICKSSRKTNSD